MKFKQSSHIFEIKRVTTIKGNYNVELSTFMTPIVKSLPSYIKDSRHALEIVRVVNFPSQDKLLFTMDITSLFRVICHSVAQTFF